MIRTTGSRRDLVHRFAILIFLVLALRGHSLEAQSESIYSTLVGTVTDASGAAVQGATVTATDVATNIKISVTSSSEGL
jgi:hypothetical protein